MSKKLVVNYWVIKYDFTVILKFRPPLCLLICLFVASFGIIFIHIYDVLKPIIQLFLTIAVAFGMVCGLIWLFRAHRESKSIRRKIQEQHSRMIKHKIKNPSKNGRPRIQEVSDRKKSIGQKRQSDQIIENHNLPGILIYPAKNPECCHQRLHGTTCNMLKCSLSYLIKCHDDEVYAFCHDNEVFAFYDYEE